MYGIQYVKHVNCTWTVYCYIYVIIYPVILNVKYVLKTQFQNTMYGIQYVKHVNCTWTVYCYIYVIIYPVLLYV